MDSPSPKDLGRSYAHLQKVTQNYKKTHIWPSVHKDEDKKCLDVNWYGEVDEVCIGKKHLI